MLKMAVRIDKIDRLSEHSVAVLRAIASAIGAEPGRVPFQDVATSLGISRSAVKYAVDQMIKNGTIELVGDALSVRNSIIWFEEPDELDELGA